MPPRKRAPPGSAGKKPKARQSKLAKENNITAEQEASIKEAYALFAVENEEYEDEKEGVIPIGDVRRCMSALGVPPDSKEELAEIIDVLDPSSTGYATYVPFLSICAMKLNNRPTDDSTVSAEVETAFNLFTKGTDGPITLVHLRRIAKELKEEISDDLLREMVLEANGGAGIHKGVSLEDFESVMSRAGAFSSR